MPRYTAQVFIATSATVEASSLAAAEAMFKAAQQDVLHIDAGSLKSDNAKGVHYDKAVSVEEITSVELLEGSETPAPVEHLGFRVGQLVHMRVDTIGGIPDGGEVTFPAGSPGRITDIREFGAQGMGFEVSIWSHDPEQAITNVFDEADGAPGLFFVAAPDLPLEDE